MNFIMTAKIFFCKNIRCQNFRKLENARSLDCLKEIILQITVQYRLQNKKTLKSKRYSAILCCNKSCKIYVRISYERKLPFFQN